MGNLGLPELLIILVVVLLIFGPGRLSKIAGEMGKGIRSFKEGLSPVEDANAEKTEDSKEE